MKWRIYEKDTYNSQYSNKKAMVQILGGDNPAFDDMARERVHKAGKHLYIGVYEEGQDVTWTQEAFSETEAEDRFLKMCKGVVCSSNFSVPQREFVRDRLRQNSYKVKKLCC